MMKPEKTFNCSQCGNQLPITFRLTKLVVCDQCQSTLLLHDDAIALYGKSAELAPTPSLIQLQQPIKYLNKEYTPVGHVRFRYPMGFWDEFWLIDNAGEGTWLSVDEGDYAFEKPLDVLPFTVNFKRLRVGSLVQKRWHVTEKDHAVCVGFKGELPELFTEGDIYEYAHLSSIGSKLLTLEYDEETNEVSATEGQWVDPFEIKVLGV